MRRFILAAIFLFLSVGQVMADTKITQLTEDTSPSADDLMITVNDPSGTPATRKATISNIIRDANIPNTITIDLAAAATALAANGSNCAASSFPLGVDASGAVESCSTSISGNAATATALAADPADCGANTFATTIAASGALTCATPALGTDTSGNYVATVADGTGIDGTASGEGTTYTPTFDATELEALTWGAGGNASNIWTFNLSGTDPTITLNSGAVAIGGALSATGAVTGSNLSGTNTGDNTVATSGDSATAFFASGTIEHERGGLEADVSAYDGLIGITGGTAYNQTGTTTQIVIFDGAGAPTSAALSGDVTMSNGGVVAIGADKITEAMLKAVDAAADEECLTREETTGDFEWQACGGGTDTNAVKEYWWPASASLPLEVGDSIPPISKDAGTNIDQLTVDLDDSTDECRTVNFKVPSDVTSGSTITFRWHWYSAAATSGNAILEIRHNGGVAEGTDPDQTLTVVAALADATQGTAGMITATVWTETLANLGWAANEQVDAEFCRDANNASDTLVGDLKTTGFGVEIPRS